MDLSKFLLQRTLHVMHEVSEDGLIVLQQRETLVTQNYKIVLSQEWCHPSKAW